MQLKFLKIFFAGLLAMLFVQAAEKDQGALQVHLRLNAYAQNIEYLREKLNEGDETVKRDFPEALYEYSVELFNKGPKSGVHRAIDLCKEAADLGNRNAKASLSEMMALYSSWLFNGEYGFKRDLPRGIEIYQEAAALGNSQAEANLPRMKSIYAVSLFNGQHGVKRDMSKAIDVCRESLALGLREAEGDLAQMLRVYSISLFQGTDGISKDASTAIELCREAVNLGDADAKHNLPLFLIQYSGFLFNGERGEIRDIPRAIDLCREAVRLDERKARSTLAQMLSIYSVFLFNGEQGFTKDTEKAIEFCREATSLGDVEARQHLSVMLDESQTNDSSSSLESASATAAEAGFKGNWTQVFHTKVGDILHAPNMIRWGYITSGKGISLHSKTVNGIPLLAPLVLNTDSTVEEFVEALRRSGIM